VGTLTHRGSYRLAAQDVEYVLKLDSKLANDLLTQVAVSLNFVPRQSLPGPAYCETMFIQQAAYLPN
jgi:hypothetical protein